MAGINARTAEKQQFLDVMCIGVANYVALYLHVLHDEVSSVKRVGHYSAHKSCGKHHSIRFLGIEERCDSILIRKIQFLVTAPHEIGVAAALKIVPYSGADQSMVARNVYLICLFYHDYSGI